MFRGMLLRPLFKKSGQFGVVKAATSLQLGDVIKGEISDLTGNEITLTLENNTMIRGQISDNSLLSIGQTAAFKLDGLSPAGVILSPVSGYTENELTLINKALQEAGLPASEHNQAAVKALMDNLMPINREAIQQLMQQAFDMKSTDMGTLALMKRLMMPVTPDSLEQFGNYRQGNPYIDGAIEQLCRRASRIASGIVRKWFCFIGGRLCKAMSSDHPTTFHGNLGRFDSFISV